MAMEGPGDGPVEPLCAPQSLFSLSPPYSSPLETFDLPGFSLVFQRSQPVQTSAFPPVIFISALGHDKTSLREAAMAVASFAPVVVFDQRGVGFSSAPPVEGFSIEELAKDAFQLSRHAFPDQEKVFLVGCSMGGYIVQSFLKLFSSFVAGAFIGCSTDDRSKLKRRRWAKIEKPTEGGEEEFRLYQECLDRQFFDQQSLNFSPGWPLENPEIFQEFLKEMKNIKKQPGVMEKYIAACDEFRMPEGILRDLVSAGRIPVLIVHGSGDLILEEKQGEILYENIQLETSHQQTDNPIVQFEKIPGCGHLFWFERPAWAAQRIAQFIKDAWSRKIQENEKRKDPEKN